VDGGVRVNTVEASALRAPTGIGRIGSAPTFLRLRSDDQLVALFRKGEEEAFRVIHDRYRQRLFAYVRQMLGSRSRQDAEDVLQDVFVRAYGSLRTGDRPVLLRAWLYRVAHNRCIDVLRKPVPAPAEIFEVSRKPLHDPIEEAQRRDDLARLVRDVTALPEHQRSALLMREIDGLPYAEISDALGVTIPAVKSLLVRARMGLVEAQEARDLDCSAVRGDLLEAYDRGVKSSARARRHMRECTGCREYKTALRGMRRSFAALSPVGFAPLALAAKALGIGSAGGGAAAGAGGAGGAAAVAGGGMATATACKVAAVVCTAALGAGGAVEVQRLVRHQEPARAPAPNVAAPAVAATAPAVAHRPAILDRPARLIAPAPAAEREEVAPITAEEPTVPALVDGATVGPEEGVISPAATGGTIAPAETATPEIVPGETPLDPEPVMPAPADSAGAGEGEESPPATGAQDDDAEQ
jgi:RNA polymerase sigma factor (sigma-70 family)